MAFHNNRFTAIEKKESGIYLARRINNELHIDFIKNNSTTFNKYIKLPIVLDEFDIDFNIEDNLDILFINNNKDLILLKQDSNEEQVSKVIRSIKDRIYYMNLINHQSTENIFYIQSTENKNIYKIIHIFMKDDDMEEYLVDEIETYEIINSFKVLKDGNNLLIFYYYKNQICLKGFDIKNKRWSHSITLTDNKNKLYMDVIKIGNILHLTYSEFDLENFAIKYERFNFDNEYILKEKETMISPKGNYTDPVILKVGNKIWICWKDTNQILSVYSTDDGSSWSEVYQWKETKRINMVKYKYITDIKDDRFHIEYVYGSTGKDIRFIGFGELKNADVLNINK